VSNASRPVARVYWTVARTAARFGFHDEGSEAAFTPKKNDNHPFVELVCRNIVSLYWFQRVPEIENVLLSLWPGHMHIGLSPRP
jgi:hypothetical protein